MRRFLPLLSFFLFAGCSREDWREASFALPPNVPAQRAVAACRALDTQTPPEVAVEGNTLRIRYNSMRVAPRNFAYTLHALSQGGTTP